MTASLRLPGSFAIPSIAPVYCDGIPVGQIETPSSRISGSQDFWSSQPRLAGDPAAEELTISLGQQRLVNYVTLDLPHFPHAVSFWWWDGARWQPLNGNNGAPLVITTSGSVPAVVDNPAALSAGLNPYHYGAGHWVHYDEPVQPVVTSRLLLRSTRPAAPGREQLPVNPAGKQVPYPLGVRNLDFGSRILSSADVPQQPRSPVTLTMRQPFTTTVDVNGSPVQVAVRENRAGDLLNGATWRCAPQPSADAVVSLYLDSRDGNGNAQVIDRFFLDPVTSGVRFNLFYSPVPPPSGTAFGAIDDPLLPGLLNAGGTMLPAAGKAGIVFPSIPGWLTLSNQAAGTVADAPWWAGIEIMPGFGAADTGTYVIADAGLLQLWYSNGTWYATMPNPGQTAAANQPSGAVLGQWNLTFAAGDRLQFAIGFDGSQFFAWAAGQGMFCTPVAGTVSPAPVFRFGGLQGINPADAVLAGNYTLTAFTLKQEQADFSAGGVPPQLTGFAADPSAYVYPPIGSAPPATQNAVARFHPAFVLGSVSPWGFVGGLGAAYEACPWVPLPRSYVLSRGYVEFDPVLAAAWKFEFTALQPEPYEFLQPVAITGQYYAPQYQPSAAEVSPTTPAVIDPGLGVNQDTAPSAAFSDAPLRLAAPDPGTVLPTEALYATDPAAASHLTRLGGTLYNFQKWQPAHIIPVNLHGGASSYQESSSVMLSRVAYFVAISGITMYRTDYTAAEDTAQYTDTFADAANIAPGSLSPGGWEFQAGTGLIAPSNITPGAAVTSKTFNSAHAVTGVQFATAQSDPLQLLSDPDFSAPGFTDWAPVGDALPLAPSPVNAQLGAMVQVSRGAGSPLVDTGNQPSSWAYLESAYATWSALLAAVPSWADFGQPPASSAMGGIGYTGAPVATTGAGRVHVAARVFASSALTAPLFLQLLDGATGTVIAEAGQSVPGGAVTEWFAGFTIGDGTVSTNTWTQVEAAYPTWSAANGVSWSLVDTSISPVGATVTARLIQKVSTSDTWDVDNISVFEDALVWEFSNDGGLTWYPAYDIRNNPRGVVTFPPAQPGQGTQLQWRVLAYAPGLTVSALAIRPWYATWPHGIMPRPAGVGHGPNMAPLDHYPAVENDPRWRLSSSPVPDSWYFSVRQALSIVSPASDFPGPAIPPPDATLGSALVWEPAAVAAQEPPTYTDLFTDIYTDQYAPADGGDIYTDDYCDIYGADYTVTTGTVFSGTASLAAAASLTATALTVPLPAYGAGADLGPVAASDPLVAAWVSGTGAPLPARRIALGNQIPATLAASPAAGDAGVRRVLFDIRPDATTTPAQLDTFLASCQAGGLQAWVSIWAGADTSFINPQDWLNLLPDYVAVIRRNGYQHVLAVSNDAIAAGWLAAWYPGDGLVDVISPTLLCTGPTPGAGIPSLSAAEAFADAHGKPLGLSGYGVDRSRFTPAQGVPFFAYVQSVFAARRAAGKPGADLFCLGTGTYSVVTGPAALLTAYEQLAAAL